MSRGLPASPDSRDSNPLVRRENRPQHLALVALVGKWARRKGATPSHCAGVAARPETPADAVRFTPAEVRELNGALQRVSIRGARLPAGVPALSGVEAPLKQI